MDESNNIFAAVVDMETTGLDANNCIPLEVGIKLIDKDGKACAAGAWLVWEDTPDWSIKMMEGAAHKFVGPMHQKSGLWDDLIAERGTTTLTRAELDNILCDFLADNGIHIGTVPMMGNSVGSLDRPFTLVHFPKFNEALHYRNIDISTLKELCKAHNPSLLEKLLPVIGTKEDSEHRVLSDIDACIVEYLAYVENFLFVEED